MLAILQIISSLQLAMTNTACLRLFRSLVDSEIGLASFDLLSWWIRLPPINGEMKTGHGSHSQGLFVLACDALLDGRIIQRPGNI